MLNSTWFSALLLLLLLPAGFSSRWRVLAAEETGDRAAHYWLQRRAEFYRNTSFELNEFHLKLLGLKRINFENKSAQPRGHLPFWFDYELFKRAFNRPSSNSSDALEELSRHHVYISSCLRAFRRRTLFRMLAGTEDTLITNDADKLYWEKAGHLLEGRPSGANDNEIAFSARLKFEPAADFKAKENERPLARAIRLMKAEMDRVESKHQVEIYLRAFNEIDGSALAANLPY